MNHEYRIKATVIIGEAEAHVTAPSPEIALERSKELQLGAWKIDESKKLTVHPTTTLDQLAKDEAMRWLGQVTQTLGGIKDGLEGLHPDVASEVLTVIGNLGDDGDLLRRMLGLKKDE